MASQKHFKSLSKLRADQPSKQRRLHLWLMLLALIILACNLTNPTPRPIVILTRLPTFTPTPLPALIAMATSPPVSAQPVVVTEPTETPPAPTVAPASEGQGPVAAATPTPLPPPDSAPAAPPPDSPTATPVAAVPTAAPLTATPVDPPPENDTPTPTPSPTASLPPPTPTPTLVAATPTPSLESAGWSFASIGRYPDEDDESLLLYGNVINNTGATQALTSITGTFYDGQGQVIADEDSMFDYWPIEILPPGGQAPFELTIYDIQEAANFDLEVGAAESNEIPHQNFEFLEVTPTIEEETYCLSGSLRNPAEELNGYLLLVLTLYDGQNNVINFGDSYISDIEGLMGDQTLAFEICADVRDQEVADYDLQAWGL